MQVNIHTAEKAVRWGNAGLSLALAVLSLISLAAEARNGKTDVSEPEK